MPWSYWLILTMSIVTPTIYAPTRQRRAAARALLALLVGRDPQAAAQAETDPCQTSETQAPSCLPEREPWPRARDS
jgi:hypothetical protein